MSAISIKNHLEQVRSCSVGKMSPAFVFHPSVIPQCHLFIYRVATLHVKHQTYAMTDCRYASINVELLTCPLSSRSTFGFFPEAMHVCDHVQAQ